MLAKVEMKTSGSDRAAFRRCSPSNPCRSEGNEQRPARANSNACLLKLIRAPANKGLLKQFACIGAGKIRCSHASL